MKIRFYCDLIPPLYMTAHGDPPFLTAYSQPLQHKPDCATRLSFEVEIPDGLIRVEDMKADAGDVTIT